MFHVEHVVVKEFIQTGEVFMLGKKLGRGLGSLISEGEDVEKPSESLKTVSINSVRPNPSQPRSVFDEGALKELASSIGIHGILQPITVRKSSDFAGYEIVAGERRWRAAKLAGLETVPVIEKLDVDTKMNLELSLIENIQRQDLNPIEKAEGYKALLQDFSLTQEEVAERVGQKRATVANFMRLLDLPEDIKENVSRGTLSMGHARALLSLESRDQQRRLAEEAMRKGLSVRAVEKAVANAQKSDGKEIRKGPAPKPQHIIDLEEKIMERLGCKTAIDLTGEHSGKIVINFADNTDFERILDVMAIRIHA